MSSGILEVSHQVSPTGHTPLSRVVSAPVALHSPLTPVSSDVMEVDRPIDEPVVVTMEPGSPTPHMIASEPELEGEESGSEETNPVEEGRKQSGDSETAPVGEEGKQSGMRLAEEIIQVESEGLEETPDVKFTQGPPESEQLDYGSSIMQSEDDSAVGAMVLNLPLLPMPDIRSDFSKVPSSPVLPTTSETILSLEQETETPPIEEQPEEDLVSFGSNELSDLEGDQLGGSSILPSNFTESLPDADADPEPATGPEPRQVLEGFEQEIEEAFEVGSTREQKLTPQQPERRPSPYPDGAAGVREALYTAWLPSMRTQEMLADPREAAKHLTCPGLVADVRMVRRREEGGLCNVKIKN